MDNLPANIWKLLGLLVFLLIVFDILFIRIFKFGKIAWKRTEYIWLSVAVLSLITVSFQVRSWLAGNQSELAKHRADSRYSMFLDYAGRNKPPNYICRTFRRTEYSPDNIENVQKEYDQLCEWNKQLLQNLSGNLNGQLTEIKFENLQPTTMPRDSILLGYLGTLKMYLDDYEQFRQEHIMLKAKEQRNGVEQLLLYLSPILICIALALRITKVTGEIKLEKS